MSKIKLVSFNCYTTRHTLKVRAHLKMQSREEVYDQKALSPFRSLMQFKSSTIALKLEIFDSSKKLITNGDFTTDRFGNLNTTLSLPPKIAPHLIKIYSLKPHYQFLAEVSPERLGRHENIVICDFDKTLVETQYHSLKEIYDSLTNSLNRYPVVKKSVELFRDLLKKDYHPFIVSASPHFYELTIRQWLAEQNLPQCPITLKNFRDIFSRWYDRLTLKDLAIHGNYKLHAILDILLMTGIPKNLALIGDSSETDAEIYLIIKKILTSDAGAWALWQEVKDKKCFRLTPRQSSKILRKINLLHGKIKLARGRGTQVEVHIYIRDIKNNGQEVLSSDEIIWY